MGRKKLKSFKIIHSCKASAGTTEPCQYLGVLDHLILLFIHSFVFVLYMKKIGFSIALLLFMCLFNIQTAVSKMVKYQMVGNLVLIHAEGPDASLVCPGPVGSGDLE